MDPSRGGAGWRALFDTADLNLFSAKRSGRNRVRAPGGAPGEEQSGDPAEDPDQDPA
jgi:hypothetical protein